MFSSVHQTNSVINIIDDKNHQRIPISKPLLQFVLVLCGAKPHRLQKSLDNLERKILSSVLSSSSSIPASTFFQLLSQVISEDVIKKNDLNMTMNSSHSYYLSNRISNAFDICNKKRSAIIFIAGPTGAGKSTLASQLANRLNITSVLSTDSIRESLRSNPAAVAACPELLTSTFETNTSSSSSSSPTDPAFSVINHFLKQCKIILKVLERQLENAIERCESVIVEGVHLVPSWMRTILKKYCVLSTSSSCTSSDANESESIKQPIIVPVFAFVGGSSKHMNRFVWRRDKKKKKKIDQEPEQEASSEEENDEDSDDGNSIKKEQQSPLTFSTPPSVSSTNTNHQNIQQNRYMKNFDHIRLIHHWFLSEIAHWFLPREQTAEIGEYQNGGLPYIVCPAGFDDDTQNDSHHHHDDDTSSHDSSSGSSASSSSSSDEHGEFFPHSRTVSEDYCISTVSVPSSSVAPKTPTIPNSSFGNNNSSSLSSSRLWFRWRRRAQGVVKLVRSCLVAQQPIKFVDEESSDYYNKNKNKNSSPSSTTTLSSFIPILDNVNLDRSVNCAHQALISWMDEGNNFAEVYEKQIPQVVQQPNHHHHHHNKNGMMMSSSSSSSMMMMQRQTSLNEETVEQDQQAILSFLQQRRRDKKKRNIVLSKNRKVAVLTQHINDNNDDDQEQQQSYLAVASLTDYGTSSGDDCEGSVGHVSSVDSN